MQSPYFADIPARHYLREWREKRGLTQEQLAKRCNTTSATISRYEKEGERLGLPLELLFRLLDALDILPGQFFAPPEAPCLDAFTVNLSAKDRHAILETVKIATALTPQERTELLESAQRCRDRGAESALIPTIPAIHT